MVYLYDMMLLVPAIAWLWSDMRLRGYHRIELLLLAGGSAGLLGAIKLGAGGPIYGALLSATLLGLALRRIGLAKRIKTA